MHRDFELFAEEERWLEENIEPPVFSLNIDQQKAVRDILEWIPSENPYFLLSGAAGTGKTFAIKALIDEIDGRIIFTAPTNKATKVLRATLTTKDYSPICRTIYSLLGLKMEANGEVKQLKSPDDPVDLKSIALVVVDEASMINQILMQEIEKAVDNYGLKFLFLGDANQLPPVNEKASAVWGMVDNKAELQKVMRFDNQILVLANEIKEKVNHPAPSINLKDDNDDLEGVWNLQTHAFTRMLLKAADNGDFSNPLALTKAIAWRNKTVGTLNELIRSRIFDNADENRWLVGDRIILTAPAANLENRPIGCTDDEGTVEQVDLANHPLYPEFPCYNLSVITDENKRINLWVLHEEGEFEYRFRLTYLSNNARLNPRNWKDYWAFADSFHKVQHGYAITAHRAQGSTYDQCFVCWNDILANRNRNEAFRCLYVACTRPKRKLILGAW